MTVDLYDGLAGTISAPRPGKAKLPAKAKDPHSKPDKAPKGGAK